MTTVPAPTDDPNVAPPSRPVALVTGASAGIGLACVELLAERGHDLVLVARRRERLDEIAARLAGAGAQSLVVAADLTDPAAAATVADAALARFGRVDVLVNNAGYGHAERFLELPWAKHRAFIEVMLTSVVELTHRLAPQMIARRYGRIAHVASLAAFVPESPGSLYSPAKRFMVSFSRSLALELRGTGVTSTAICPGFTYSEFHDVMGNRGHMNTLPKWLWMDARAVARLGLDATFRGDAVIIPGAVNKAIAALCWLLPASAIHALAPKSVMERHDRVDR
ncbi:MAG: SDR family oxidoreductase [Phycisphaerae bacterium]|nr:SDR family oxidoreductase [Phycisphaerae bacterium]